MNSKEALKKLWNDIEFLTRIDYVPAELREEVKQTLIKKYQDVKTYYENIEKDLEVLEMLKKALTAEQHFKEKENGFNMDYMVEYIIKENQLQLDTLLTQKLTEWIIKNIDKKQVKEWLKDE